MRFSAGLASSFAALTLAVWSVGPVAAEEASAPRVTIIQSGANELIKDIEFLLKLTTPEEQKQLPVVKEYLEVFLPGIDRTLPIRVDLKFGNPAMRYVSSFPILNNEFDGFRKNNLQGLGINSKKKGGLYELSSAFTGWMNYAAPYATIAEVQGDLPSGDPRTDIKDLLAKNCDVVAQGRNVKIDADAQADRRKDFQNTRKELLGALKKKKEESEADFELKKKLFEYQLDEAERFFVESESLTLGWITDGEKEQGTLEIELAPIAGSSLETVIAGLGTTPSYFAGIDRSARPILSARLNHPLDEPRQKSLLDLADVLKTRAKDAADASTELSADEKNASKKLADMVFDVLSAGTKAGLLDCFIEVHANDSGKHTLVSGFRTADGTAVTEMLKIFPDSRKGRAAKLDADQEGDVKIHEVTISEKDHPHYQTFFGGPVLYVGSSKEAVWCAAGENALAELKAAIKKRAEASAKPAEAPFAELYVKLEPWLKLREERDPQQGNPKFRKLAIEAFSPGADVVSLQLSQKDKKVVGRLVIEAGILRFAGKAVADFSRENLDESQPQPAKKAAKAAP